MKMRKKKPARKMKLLRVVIHHELDKLIFFLFLGLTPLFPTRYICNYFATLHDANLMNCNLRKAHQIAVNSLNKPSFCSADGVVPFMSLTVFYFITIKHDHHSFNL